MNTVNFDDPTPKGGVGVHRGRLVVTTRPIDYGTFAVTTDENWTMIPEMPDGPHKASSFRLNNYTGKMIGVRRRHNKFVVDDFEDRDFSDWTGSVLTGRDIQGSASGLFSSQAYRSLTTEAMLDGSEVEVTFDTIQQETTRGVTIKIWDSAARIGTGDPPAAKYDATPSGGRRRVIFRLRPSVSEYDTFLEEVHYANAEMHAHPHSHKATHVMRTTETAAGTGEFGLNDMKDSVISIESTGEVTVDPIIYQQKVNWSNELMGHGASFVYPCEDNISEYEVINLGSDALGYTDNTQDVSLGGFYAV